MRSSVATIVEAVRELTRGIVVEHDDGRPWQSAPLLDDLVLDRSVDAWPAGAEATDD